MEERYPRLEINLAHLKHNVTKVVEKCGDMGIQVAGVIKGATGLPEVAKAFDEGGAAFIASSIADDSNSDAQRGRGCRSPDRYQLEQRTGCDQGTE